MFFREDVPCTYICEGATLVDLRSGAVLTAKYTLYKAGVF